MNSMRNMSFFALLMLAAQMPHSHAGLADEVEKLKLEQEYDYLKAKKALQNCLILEKYQQKNVNGYPIACESWVASFAVYAPTEAQEITKLFAENAKLFAGK